MESFTTYKLFRKPKQHLMDVPPYCRKHETRGEDGRYPYGGDEDLSVSHVKLEVSDPSNILALCESLTDSSPRAIEKKINKYLQTVTESEIVFIITLHDTTEEAVVHVVGRKYLEPPIRQGITADTLAHVKEHGIAQTDGYDMDADLSRIIKAVLATTDLTKVYTVSIIPKSHKTKFSNEASSLVVCLFNCKIDPEIAKRHVRETFRFCLPLLLNTWNCQEEQRIKIQCQSLLAIARRLFSHLGDLDDLLREIMSEARRLTNAERCSLFLLDSDHVHLVAKVFDGVAQSSNVVRIARDQGIAGHVAETGKLLNIRDAYKHPLFYKGMDEETGFITRNILCFPIRDENGIIGIAQLCNKIGGHFDCYDEEAALAFSIYCGLSIMHSLVYKKIQDAQRRSQLSNELMMYHMKVNSTDVIAVSLCPNKHDHPDFQKITFSSREIEYKETPCYMLKLFLDNDYINKFQVKRETLVRFILHVQKGYRDTPYHNWSHAFSVTHFAYLCIVNFKLVEKHFLTDLDAFVILISCMCHDIDHRGTTNSFQLQSENILAGLYSSEGSVMERHHLSQALCILNTKDCNIFESLDQTRYAHCLDMLRDNILATDLANHFKMLAEQKEMTEQGFKFGNLVHNHQLRCLIMTCSDLNDQTKTWKTTKRVAELIYEEFFHQGDLEKSMGRTPIEMMDRERASIPDLQIDFIKDVCLPVYKVLVDLFPEGAELYENLKTNIFCWETSKIVFERRAREGATSMDILKSPTLEKDVLDQIALIYEKNRMDALRRLDGKGSVKSLDDEQLEEEEPHQPQNEVEVEPEPLDEPPADEPANEPPTE